MHRLLRMILWRIGIIGIVIVAAFFFLRSRYRDVISDLARTQVMNTTSDLTNDAIAKQIAAGNIAYDRIVFFEKDLDGRITALKTNMSEVNRLKTDILAACFCRNCFPEKDRRFRCTFCRFAILMRILSAIFPRPASTRPCTG